MRAAPDPTVVLRAQLADAAASFSIGVPAAVAEFLREPGEPFEVGEAGLSVTTPRGGIHLSPPTAVRPLAYEAPSRRPERWLQGVVFCLPDAEARMGGRRVLSALGSDGAARRAPDREAALFDLGVGAPHLDFCVRTGDAGLAERLHAGVGQAMADWPEDLVAALFAASPHRVVRSRLGRIEVTGSIPSERTILGPIRTCSPSSWAKASPTTRRSRCRRAGCHASSSTRPIPSSTWRATRSPSTRRGMTPSKRCSRPGAIRLTWRPRPPPIYAPRRRCARGAARTWTSRPWRWRADNGRPRGTCPHGRHG